MKRGQNFDHGFPGPEDFGRGRRGWGPERGMGGHPGRGFGPDHGHHGPPHIHGPFPGRMRRGDVRGVLLSALLEGPAHGYELIRRLEERSFGAWRPSPGSVYPTLQMLEEQDLVSSQEQDGKRVYTLTEEGHRQAEERTSRPDFPNWEGPEGSTSRREMREAIGTLRLAVDQAVRAGNDEQVAKVAAVLKEARQQIYRLLAES
jgi:DNA-binding PadR family transcriptional regulator